MSILNDNTARHPRLARFCPRARVLGAVLALAFAISAGVPGCAATETDGGNGAVTPQVESGQPSPDVISPGSFDAAEVPAYAGEPSIAVNGDAPYFTEAELTLDPLERYAPLDGLGRCGAAIALVGEETMPTEPRGSIGMVRPSGWQLAKYDWVDGGYLFNRCHLIGYQLAGENANPQNLITGTRYLNVEGMLLLENEVAAYVHETGNHVLMRVTPVFEGDELVARGVLMEARSIEDGGDGVEFCRWCYNVQPGVVIDYATGENHAEEGYSAEDAEGGAVASGALGAPDGTERAYVLNTNTKRFHLPECSAVSSIKGKNRVDLDATRAELIDSGYTPCGICNP